MYSKYKIIRLIYLSSAIALISFPAIASELPVYYLAIPLVTLVLGAVLGYFLFARRVETWANDANANSSELLLSTVDGGYYYHNLKSGKKIVSDMLQEMLNIDAEADNRLSSFEAALEPQSYAMLSSMIGDLKIEGKKQILFYISSKDFKSQFECCASTVQDSLGAVMELIIWFRDITSQQKIITRLTKENEKLKSDVKQYSTILNMLPYPVWQRGDDLNIRYCNLAYSEVAEEAPERVVESEDLELHKNARILAKVAKESGESKGERRHIIVEGQRKLFQFYEIPVLSDKMMVGVAQDVTELETIQEELGRHISAQKDLLESTASAVAVYGSDTRLKYFNYAYVRLWALDEAWLETQPTYSEVLEVLREKRRLPEQANFPVFKQQQQKLFTDLIEPREDIFYLPDGKTLRVLTIPHALGGILFSYEDVTDRLALERSYNTLTAVQRATLDNLHEGVVVFGEDGRLRLYNPVYLKMWKLEDKGVLVDVHVNDILEMTRELYDIPGWDVFKQDFSRQLHNRSVQRQRIERKDSKVFDAIWVPLPDGASLISYTDVTDSTLVERSLRERNDALQEADRLKSEFLANVSYELRSPLTSITGFSEMLKQDYFGELSPKQKEYVAGIHKSSNHLMQLINDILDIASIEAGYMRLEIKQFDIYTMMSSVSSLINERVRENKIKLVFECKKDIGVMLADETRVKQILFNLLNNAIKFTDKGSSIKLGASIQPDDGAPESVIFYVEDNGMGIAPEEQAAVFGKFYRKVKSGTGLGLSMVKSFVELHGGRVDLKSELEKGTRISCILPRFNQELLQYGKTLSKTPANTTIQ
jgi:signal transduction histidine kinase